MGFGWEGEKTRLVPLEIEKHLDNAVRWLNDPDVTEFLMIGDFPLSNLAERLWFESKMKGEDREIGFGIETLEGRHIGFSGIHAVDWRHGTAITGTILGEKDEWGKGYGTDAAKVRARYAFDVLGLRILQSGYLGGNERSRRMQENAGYRECGRIPLKYWKRGAYRDEVLTCLHRDDWAS